METFDTATARLLERVRAGEFIDNEGPFDAELARLEVLSRSELAAKDTAIAEKQEFIRRHLTQSALQEALTAAGIAPRFHKGAMALFRQSHRLEIECDDDGERTAVVATEDGPVTVESAVGAWSNSEDAVAFRAPAVAPAHFAAQLRLLR